MDTNLIEDSLTTCAERVGDITDAVYQRFFAADPAAYDLMAHSDEHMRGRMLAQTLELVLTDEHLGEGGYLRWEVNNHLLAYGVDVDMYANFLEALRATVEQGLGADWRPAYAAAWGDKIAALLTDIYAEADA